MGKGGKGNKGGGKSAVAVAEVTTAAVGATAAAAASSPQSEAGTIGTVHVTAVRGHTVRTAGKAQKKNRNARRRRSRDLSYEVDSDRNIAGLPDNDRGRDSASSDDAEQSVDGTCAPSELASERSGGSVTASDPVATPTAEVDTSRD